MQLEVIGGLCMLLVQIPLLSRFTFLDQATFLLHVMEQLLVFLMLFFSGFRCIYLSALQWCMSW